MTQEITRWLTEIRTLQQQLASARAERDQAYQSAANWRQRYDAEATQRREEAARLQATVATLRTELETLRAHREDAVTAVIEEQLDVTDIHTVDGLRTELIKVLQSCDRLQQALQAEKADHAETRKTLTSALGEAIDVMHASSSLVPASSSENPRSPTAEA
jgi:chromosome segregation ATPase